MVTLVSRGEITPDPSMRAEIDAKIVEMIARTISANVIDFTSSYDRENCEFNASGDVVQMYSRDIEPFVLARAVLAKLRAEGLVR